MITTVTISIIIENIHILFLSIIIAIINTIIVAHVIILRTIKTKIHIRHILYYIQMHAYAPW